MKFLYSTGFYRLIIGTVCYRPCVCKVLVPKPHLSLPVLFFLLAQDLSTLCTKYNHHNKIWWLHIVTTNLKAGQPITNVDLIRIGKIKVYKRFTKFCTKLLSLRLPDNAKKELKFSSSAEIFHPLQGSFLILTTSSTYTHTNKWKFYIWIRPGISSIAKTHFWPQKQLIGYVGFQEKFNAPPTQTNQSKPSLRSSTHLQLK